MNTDEAITFLAKKGIKVDRINKKQFRVWDVNGKVWEAAGTPFFTETLRWWDNKKREFFWTGREVIKLARAYTDSTQQTTLHKTVKKFSNDKDRTATRDAINKGDFDKIPQNRRTKEEDPWSWD